MAHAPGFSRIGDLAKHLDQSALSFKWQFVDIDHRHNLLGVCMKWCKKRGTQILGYTLNQWTHENPLGLSVGAIGAVVFGESAGFPQNLPACRPIAGALKTAGVHKGLGQHYGMAETAQPIRTEALEVLGQDPGGKIWPMPPRQDEKPHVVSQKV